MTPAVRESEPGQPSSSRLPPPGEAVWSSFRLHPSSLDFPPKPLAHPPPHDPLQVLALQPRQFLGEERDALLVGARQAREIGAPERTLRAERVVGLADVRMKVAEGIFLGREKREAAHLGRYVRVFRHG